MDNKLEFGETALAVLIERAQETIDLVNDPYADSMSFWRARARYFAEEIVRAIKKAT